MIRRTQRREFFDAKTWEPTPPDRVSMKNLPPEVLDLKVKGSGLIADRFGAALAKPTLLVLLRPKECMFTRELLDDLLAARRKLADFPNVILVLPHEAPQSESAFAEFSIIEDVSRELYEYFARRVTGESQIHSPHFLARVRAMMKGHFPRKTPRHDFLPSLLLVEKGLILWQHKAEHVGDLPSLEMLPAYLRRSDS